MNVKMITRWRKRPPVKKFLTAMLPQQSDPSLADRKRHRFSPAVNTHFAEDITQVHLNSTTADRERIGNFLVALAERGRHMRPGDIVLVKTSWDLARSWTTREYGTEAPYLSREAALWLSEQPIKAVRILGENLVVFRDTAGKYGLVAERCPHRSASLSYGRVDAEGIRCPYHGWKFDHSGRCLQQPAEPDDKSFKDRVRTRAYPVQKLAGLLYTYMGPEPVPLLPRWDVLVREDGKRWTVIESMIDCNWLQPMENSVDPSHLYWLHGDSAHLMGHQPDYGETHDYLFGTKGTVLHDESDRVLFLPPGRKTNAAEWNAGGGYREWTDQHMENFFDCVRSRKEPNCPFDMGYRTAIACQMAVASYRRQRAVRWDPQAEVIV